MHYSRKEIIELLKPIFKVNGFKKSKSTWHKYLDGLILVFNVQGSLYGPEYYLNVAIYVNALGLDKTPYEYQCHIRGRIDSNTEYENTFQEIMLWYGLYDSIEKLKELNRTNALPLTTDLRLKNLLVNNLGA